MKYFYLFICLLLATISVNLAASQNDATEETDSTEEIEDTVAEGPVVKAPKAECVKPEENKEDSDEKKKTKNLKRVVAGAGGSALVVAGILLARGLLGDGKDKKKSRVRIFYSPTYNLGKTTAEVDTMVDQVVADYGLPKGARSSTHPKGDKNYYHYGIFDRANKYYEVSERLKQVPKIAPLIEQNFDKSLTIADQTLAHSSEYISSLKDAKAVGEIVENGALRRLSENVKTADVPLAKQILKSQEDGVAGTVAAAFFAMENGGFAVNLSGGYHHSFKGRGEGYCIINDVAIAIEKLRKRNPQLGKVMIIDLDAHMGNGNADIYGKSKDVVIIDSFNRQNYPYGSRPHETPRGLSAMTIEEAEESLQKGTTFYKYRGQDDIRIHYPIAFDSGISDTSAPEAEYTQNFLKRIQKTVVEALDKEKPAFIFYNAGSDPYIKDDTGEMAVSRDGILARDLFIVKEAKARNIPIVWVLSGGYSGTEGAHMIADSITNVLQHVTF